MNRRKYLRTLFDDLTLLYTDLTRLIVSYDAEVYSTKPTKIWQLGGRPQGITSDQEFVYFNAYALFKYNLEGQQVPIKRTYALICPTDMEFYENKFYIIDKKNVRIFSSQLDLLTTFDIIDSKPESNNHMKIDENIIGISIEFRHQIYIYTKDGELKQRIGVASSSVKQGEFNNPCGLTIDKTSLFICDSWNDRIQILNKNKNYSFEKEYGQWGTENGFFVLPYVIYSYQEVFYIGDAYSVQLFDDNGNFLQKIGKTKNGEKSGEFDYVCGICVVKDRMYVCDSNNKRIQIFLCGESAT